jgi:hypothetical protein
MTNVKTQLLAFAILVGTLTARPQGTIEFQNRVPGLVITHIYAPLVSDPMRGQIGNGTDDTPPDTQDWTDFTLIGVNGALGPFGGATTFAQLLGAHGFDQPEQSLLPAQPTTTFRTGAAAGYVSGVTVTLSNVPYDSEATLEMVAWDNSSGLYPTWTQAVVAWQAGLIAAGASGRWNQLTLSPLSPSPPIIGGSASTCISFPSHPP